jgi:hypothetical protein
MGAKTHVDWCNSCQESDQGLDEQETQGVFLQRPSAKRAGELLNLSRNQLRVMIGLLIGHYNLKGHLFKFGLVESPQHNRCKQASEMVSHVLCDWEALAVLTFRTPGPALLETRWLCWHLHEQDTTIWSKCGAAECLSNGLHKRSKMVEVQGKLQCLPCRTVLYSTLLQQNSFNQSPDNLALEERCAKIRSSAELPVCISIPWLSWVIWMLCH